MFIYLENKIRNATLTKTGKKVAEFILNHTEESLFMTSTDLAAAIGVSDTSIIRFTRSLGYSGFNDFKKDMQNNFNEIFTKKKNLFTSPLELLERNVPIMQDRIILDQYFSQSLKNLEQTLEKNNSEEFENAAKLLTQSRKKYISGFRGCSGLANWMCYILSHMLKDVNENTESGAIAFEKILDINQNDVLVLISLPRYNNVGIDVLKYFKSKGSKIILITDKITAPGTDIADILFFAPTENMSFFNSHLASLFICEGILNSTSKLIGTSNEDRLKTIEEFITPYGFY